MKAVLKDLMRVMAKPLIHQIHDYRDKHKGESCYIIGDGVSVKWFDLEVFNDKLSFLCNFLPFHNDAHKLNAPYLSMVEPWWFMPFERTLYQPQKKIYRNPRQKFYRNLINGNQDKTFFINLSNYLVLREKNIIYTYMDFNDPRLPENFITSRIKAYEGSLRFLVTLAIYMGFKNCHLVGFDYTHLPSRSLHWYERGEGIFTPLDEYNKDFFDIANEYMDITTITLDGSSNYLNSITYKEYSGLEPSYRENTDLMSSEHLKAMDAWPDYRIFE